MGRGVGCGRTCDGASGGVSGVIGWLVFAVLLTASTWSFPRVAQAISEITNTTTVSPQVFEQAPEVRIKTSTKYGWFYFPNPYASNYQINVNRAIFKKPVLLGTNLSTSKSWIQVAEDPDIGGQPSWRIQWGTWYITGTQTRYYNASSSSKALSSGAREGLVSHGQYDVGPTNNNSGGAPDVKNVIQYAADCPVAFQDFQVPCT